VCRRRRSGISTELKERPGLYASYAALDSYGGLCFSSVAVSQTKVASYALLENRALTGVKVCSRKLCDMVRRGSERSGLGVTESVVPGRWEVCSMLRRMRGTARRG
jgi:hypothetical protein